MTVSLRIRRGRDEDGTTSRSRASTGSHGRQPSPEPPKRFLTSRSRGSPFTPSRSRPSTRPRTGSRTWAGCPARPTPGDRLVRVEAPVGEGSRGDAGEPGGPTADPVGTPSGATTTGDTRTAREDPGAARGAALPLVGGRPDCACPSGKLQEVVLGRRPEEGLFGPRTDGPSRVDEELTAGLADRKASVSPRVQVAAEGRTTVLTVIAPANSSVGAARFGRYCSTD